MRLPARSCIEGLLSGLERKTGWVATTSPAHRLLIRRSISTPSQPAFYLCHTPGPTPIGRLVAVAGARWTIEECFQTGKNEVAFDPYQRQRIRDH